MIRTVQVKDAGQIRDLCHQALGYDSTLEKVAAQIEKFNLPDSGHFCRSKNSICQTRVTFALFMKRTKQALFLVMSKQRPMRVYIAIRV